MNPCFTVITRFHRTLRLYTTCIHEEALSRLSKIFYIETTLFDEY
jgi:hypothetical protein